MKIVLVAKMLREEILLALYNNAKYQGAKYALDSEMQKLGRMSSNGSLEKASQLVLERMKSGPWYFDTIDLGEGPRELKVQLGLKDVSFNAEDFDNAHGEEAAASAMQDLRVIHTKNVARQLNPEEQKASELPEPKPKLIVVTHQTPVSGIKDLEDPQKLQSNQRQNKRKFR